MLLNDMKFSTDVNGDIYYEFENGNTIKLGEYKFKPESKRVDIDIIDIAHIKYEGDNEEPYVESNRYWFKSQYVCDRYHGCYCRHDAWITDLFEEVSPFTEDINKRLEKFFTIAFNLAMAMPGKKA